MQLRFGYVLIAAATLAPMIAVAHAGSAVLAVSPGEIQIDVASPLTTVHTSAGANLTLAIYVSRTTLPGEPNPGWSVSIGFGTSPAFASSQTGTSPASSATHTFEAHSWSFTLPKSSGQASVKNGAFSLDTAGLIQPFGHLNLTFRPSSHSPQTCSDGSGTVYNGKFTGSFRFATGIKAWGAAGRSTGSFSFPAGGSLTIGRACIASQPATPCQSGVLWFSPTVTLMKSGKVVGSESFLGQALKPAAGQRHGTITAERDINLPKPAGVSPQRQDVLSDVTASQNYDATNKTLTIKAFQGVTPIFTGAASIAVGSATAQVDTYDCPAGSVHKTQTRSEYQPVAWTNSAQALTAHFMFPGPVSIPDGSTSLSVYTYK